MEQIDLLIKKISQPKIWDKEPVFCFTSDIDWASEAVMQRYFDIINPLELKPTLFLTHKSDVINKNWHRIDKGIHPNFLSGSSHGETFKQVIDTVKYLAPGSLATRSHRGFEVTDTSHLLFNEGFRYSSNCITVMQPEIKPVLHESGLINFPVFFEDGTHLRHGLNLDIEKYIDQFFNTPGIKIISFHPMNFVLNVPTFKYMREIKNNYSRDDYQSMSESNIMNLENRGMGIRNTVLAVIDIIKRNDYPVMSLNELYKMATK